MMTSRDGLSLARLHRRRRPTAAVQRWASQNLREPCWSGGFASATGNYVDVEVGGDRLYDLALDPNEAVNEVDVPEYSQLLLDLQNELETWWLQ